MSNSAKNTGKPSPTAKLDWLTKFKFVGYVTQEIDDLEQLASLDVGGSVTPTIPFYFRMFGNRYKLTLPIERVE
jgi:hypothetical protein